MHRVLIVEDELLVRIGIASSVPWDKLHLHLIGQVEDGLKAWQAYEQFEPDIVITDLRMPGMDGFELIQKIRAAGNDCAFIVITNVENEETIRQLQNLGVSEILLKASMKQSDILAALLHVKEKLPSLPDHSNSCNEALLWADFFSGIKSSAPFQVKGLIAMHIFDEENLPLKLPSSLKDLLVHRFDRPDEFAAVDLSGELFLLFKTEQEDLKTEKILANLSRYVQDTFDARSVFCAIFDPVTESSLLKLQKIISAVIKERLYFSTPVLILDAEGKLTSEGIKYCRFCYRRLLPIQEKNQLFSENKGLFDRLINLSSGAPDVYQAGKDTLLLHGEQKVPADFIETVQQAINTHIAYLKKASILIRPELAGVLDYINLHLGKELKIEEMAGMCGYHPVYFSRLFKSELGCNFSEYIIKARLLQAKSLLNDTDQSLQEIAMECGFSDVSYFGVRFKHETGLTPGQWRERQ